MGIKEKFTKRYADSYLKKYGDRITQVQGNVVSIKVEAKSILWIFHKLRITILVRPERSKSVVKCIFKKNKWFKKPSFITITQGNLVVVQGMKGIKGKEDREHIQIMNVRNLSTKKDLVPTDGKPQKTQRMQRVR
jgi:hypothetical protein